MNRTELHDLTRYFMDLHGLKEWSIRIGSAKNIAGTCNYTRKQITMSSHLAKARTKEHTVDTILHEIAHALAGSKAGHGKDWKDVCVRIGARPERCFDTEEIAPEYLHKWIAICPSHPENHYGMNRRNHNYRCPKCHGKLHYAEYSQPEPRTYKPFKSQATSMLHKLGQVIEEQGATLTDDGVLLAPVGKVWWSTTTHYLDPTSPYYTETDSGRDRTPNAIYKMLIDEMSSGTVDCHCIDCQYAQDNQ